MSSRYLPHPPVSSRKITEYTTPPARAVQFINIPVITSEAFIGYEALKEMEIYAIYRIWKSLSKSQKQKYRKDFQRALQPRSLAFQNKKDPALIPPELKLLFNEVDYDWEEMDLVKTLEKMYFVYEPRYWWSFQIKRRGVFRPLFLGYIDWRSPKISKRGLYEDISRIRRWMEYIDIEKQEINKILDDVTKTIEDKGAYVNPRTERFEPDISLWVFFTQDQNPAAYTQGKFRALGRDKEVTQAEVSPLKTEEFRRKVQEILTAQEEISPTESLETSESVEDVGKITLAKPEDISPLFLGLKERGNVFYIGQKWKFNGKDRDSGVLHFTGYISDPTARSKTNILPESPRASLVNLKGVYEKDYLIPPLKRGLTFISSEEDLRKAIQDIKRYMFR